MAAIIRQCLISSICYGSLIFSQAPQRLYKKIQTIINDALRTAFGVPRFCANRVLFRISGLPPWNQLCEQYNIRYILRVLGTENQSGWNMAVYSFLRSHTGDNRYMYPPLHRIRQTWSQLHLPVVSIMRFSAILQPSLSPDFVHTTHIGHNKQLIDHSTIRQLFLDYAESRFPDAEMIYTDGSKNATSCGFGIYYPRRNISISRSIPPVCSIYTAEAYGIYHAVRTLCVEHTRYVICTDSLSVLHTLLNCRSSRHPVIQRLLKLVHSLHPAIRVHFLWTPGHIGISNHDTADYLARVATSLPVHPSLRFSPVQDLITYTRQRWTTLDEQEWNSSVYAAKFPHLYTTFREDLLQGLTRSQEVAFHRLRTYTIVLNRMAHLMGRAASPHCPHCGELETVPHLFQCRQYQSLRQTLSFNSSDIGLVLQQADQSAEYLNSVLQYLKDTNRIDY